MNANSVKGMQAAGKLSTLWKVVSGQSRDGQWSCDTYSSSSSVWRQEGPSEGVFRWNARVVRHSHVLGRSVAIEALARTKVEAMQICESIASMPL